MILRGIQTRADGTIELRRERELAAVLIHELGHTLGLHHTHAVRAFFGENNGAALACYQEYVSRTKTLPFIPCVTFSGMNAAEVNGDLLSDTPADPGFIRGEVTFVTRENEGCNFIRAGYPEQTDHDGVSWLPDTRNVMSYSRDECIEQSPRLSPMQHAVMLNRLLYGSGYHSSVPVFANYLLADIYEGDDRHLSATATRPEFLERQHHTIHAKCDEDWVRFEVGYFRKMVIETRAPFGMSDPSRYADTQIELYSRDAAGNPVLITSDDNSGTGNFSKIEMFLPAGTYFVRVTDQTPNLTLPLHYLIGVFNEFALWGDESAGGAGNSAS
jgi:hypothetical protein